MTVVQGEREGFLARFTNHKKITNHESRIFEGPFSSRVATVTRFLESGLVGVLYGRR